MVRRRVGNERGNHGYRLIDTIILYYAYLWCDREFFYFSPKSPYDVMFTDHYCCATNDNREFDNINSRIAIIIQHCVDDWIVDMF